MRRIVFVALVMAPLAGCAASPPLSSHHLSVREHMTAAAAHDRVADQQEALAGRADDRRPYPPVQCFDRPLAGVTYAGGDPFPVMGPCWTVHSPRQRLLMKAERERRLAAEHRAAAAQLVRAEERACSGLGADDIHRGPFFHRADIAAVEPYRERGVLRGARVLFKPVAGLDARWMRHALSCQQARAAALGYPATFEGGSPASLPEVGFAVVATPRGVLVTLRSTRDVIAATVLGRAEDLRTRPAPATPPAAKAKPAVAPTR